jgi:hypothetical protein
MQNRPLDPVYPYPVVSSDTRRAAVACVRIVNAL